MYLILSKIFYLFFIFNLFIKCQGKFTLTDENSELISNGRKEYELLLKKKSLPVYGQCWEEAIMKLENNCDHLDENRQSWLSIIFLNCFLKQLGSELSQEECKLALDNKKFILANVPKIKDCLKSLIDTKIFDTFTLFYVHTQSICFYLITKKWQSNTENLVNNLVEGAHKVSNDLNFAVKNIQDLERLQNFSLKAQISINKELSQTNNNLEKFNEQTKVQRDLIERIMTQFTLLQDFLMTEFSTSSSILFYAVVLFFIYFITTPQCTIGIRPILILIMFACLILERNCLGFFDGYFSPNYSTIYFPFSQNFNLDTNNRKWFLRKIMCLLQMMVYVWRFITYTDLAEISYRLLNENTILLQNIEYRLSLNQQNLPVNKSNCYFNFNFI